MCLTSWISLVAIQSFSSGLLKHSVFMFFTSSMVYSFCSRHINFSFKKSNMTKYRLQRSSLLERSYVHNENTQLTILLWAFSEAKDTVPLKSAFFLWGTGYLVSSRCFFAKPKSTMNTCLLSLESTKLDYKKIMSILNKLQLWHLCGWSLFHGLARCHQASRSMKRLWMWMFTSSWIAILML